MTKDDPLLTAMDQNITILSLNLNEPLTDQLAKHRIMQKEKEWGGRSGDGGTPQPTARRTAADYEATEDPGRISCEAVDLAVRRVPDPGSLVSAAAAAAAAGHESYGKHRQNGSYEKPAIKADRVGGGGGGGNWIYNGSKLDTDSKTELSGKVLAPPPPLKKTDGGLGGGGGGGGGQTGPRPGSAFLPVDRPSRDFVPGVFRGAPAAYPPFCVLPPPPPPLPHLLLQSPPSSALPSGAPPPHLLYGDAHVTHRLELLWQQKYPHLPVPPAWMLHQYTDELIRNAGQLLPPPPPPPSSASALDRIGGGGGREAVDSMGGSGVVQSPVDRKRDRKEGRVAMDTKRPDGQIKEEPQTRKKSDSKDRKIWQSNNDSNQQQQQQQQQQQARDKSRPDWQKLGQKQQPADFPSVSGGGGAVPAAAQGHHQRTEFLVDASAAASAVDQHFQESLLRLNNSQNHLERARSGEDRGTEKHRFHGNSGFSSWKDRKAHNDVLSDLTKQTDSASRAASKAATSQVSFDIYGYQPHHQRPAAYGAEKPRQDATAAGGKDSFLVKLDRSALRNGHQDPVKHSSSSKKSPDQQLHQQHQQQQHQRPNSGFPGVSGSRPDIRDAWNPPNCSPRIPDRRELADSRNPDPTKRMTEVRLSSSAGSPSAASSSPTPGSAVKDSRLGPSRLIAGSPRPLPSIFYPHDPRLEPVYPYQVSIEPVERWPATTWMQQQQQQCLLLSGIGSNGVHLQQQRTSGFPPEAHLKIQQGLVPNPAHSSAAYRGAGGRGVNGLDYKAPVLDPDPNPSASCVNGGVDCAARTSGKRFTGREEEEDAVAQCLKRAKTGPFASGADGSSPLGSIDSFKSFVDQAVYNAFLEDSDKRADQQQKGGVTRVSPFMRNFSLASLMDPDRQPQNRPVIPQLSDPDQSLTAAMSSSPTQDRRSHEAMAKPGAAGAGKTWSHAAVAEAPCSDALSTLSCDTVASSDEQKSGGTGASSAPSPHPPPLHSPPSPRTTSSSSSTSSSLHVKKAWLARYSDIVDRKESSPNGSSAVEFPYSGSDDSAVQNCIEHGFTDLPGGLPSSAGTPKPSPDDEAAGAAGETQADGAFEAPVDRARSIGAGALLTVSNPNTPKSQSHKDTDSNSDTSVDSDTSKSQNSAKASKRRARFELATGCQKLAKTAACQKTTSTTNGMNSWRMRGKPSKTSEDEAAGMSSDYEMKQPSQAKKKSRVRNSRALEARQENLTSTEQCRKMSDVFLQDGSCLKVAQRLPKCRECKTQQTNKNNTQTGNICKFDVFRKLCYSNKGVLSAAGFLEPSDIEASDLDLWVPPEQPKRTPLTVAQAQHLVTHLRPFFSHLLQQDTSLRCPQSSEEDDEDDSGVVLWRRPVEGVQETCDACDAVVFDVHWTCTKCGFVVCNDCHRRRAALDEADDDDDDRDEATGRRPVHEWPPCSSRREVHDPSDLLMTQIIPQEALSALMQKFKSACKNSSDDWQMDGFCNRKPKSEHDENDVMPSSPSKDVNLNSIDTLRRHRHLPEGNCCQAKATDNDDTSVKASLEDIKTEQVDCSDAPNTGDDAGFDSVGMPSLDFHGQQLGVAVTDSEEEALRVFQRKWQRSMPVVVRCPDEGLSSERWRPEAFQRRFGYLRLELVNCLNGSVHRFQSLERLWSGWKSSSTKLSGMVRFKDWPLADDWAGPSFRDHLADVAATLPVPAYTRSDGPFNLASHLPEFFHQPDLATRISFGYGSFGRGHVTVAKMQTTPVDSVNVVMFADDSRRSSEDDDDPKSDAAYVKQLLKHSGFTGDTSQYEDNPEKVVAIWHTYHPTDSDKIQTFLDKVCGNALRKGADQNRTGLSSDAGSYLDAELQEMLRRDTGIQATVTIQRLGDAVFIPATAFYQVKVIQECVSVTKEFISPESIGLSFTKSTQSSDWNCSDTTRNKKQEHFQIKNLVYHTMKNCIGVLNELGS